MFNTQLLYLDVELREAQRRKALSDRGFAVDMDLWNHRRPFMAQRVATNVLRHLGIVLIYLGQRLTQRDELARRKGTVSL